MPKKGLNYKSNALCRQSVWQMIKEIIAWIAVGSCHFSVAAQTWESSSTRSAMLLLDFGNIFSDLTASKITLASKIMTTFYRYFFLPMHRVRENIMLFNSERAIIHRQQTSDLYKPCLCLSWKMRNFFNSPPSSSYVCPFTRRCNQEKKQWHSRCIRHHEVICVLSEAAIKLKLWRHSYKNVLTTAKMNAFAKRFSIK